MSTFNINHVQSFHIFSNLNTFRDFYFFTVHILFKQRLGGDLCFPALLSLGGGQLVQRYRGSTLRARASELAHADYCYFY